MDLAIAFAGVAVLLENKNLVFLGTSIGKGYDPLPFATGTCRSTCIKLIIYQIYQESTQIY